jgi:phosphoribosyl 1,2-cyclic phosphate phosphodiesterase
LEWTVPPFTNTPGDEPIAVFGNEAVIAKLRAEFADPQRRRLDLRPPLEALKPVTTPTGDTVLPLPADHGAPGSLVLRVTRAASGKAFFYGHDSGLYPQATLDTLADGPPLDVALLDCTYGGQPSSNRGHMGVDGVIQMAEAFRERGIATDATRIIATHFSHNGGLLHEELVRAFLPHAIEVAFDGMVVRV